MGVGHWGRTADKMGRERVDPIHSQSELYLKLWELVGPSTTHLPWETYGGWGKALLKPQVAPPVHLQAPPKRVEQITQDSLKMNTPPHTHTHTHKVCFLWHLN